MKKIVLSLSIIGLIYGCQKDKITPNSVASNQSASNQGTFNRNPDMSEIENNILDFGELMDSEDNGEPMSVEDVVWNLEALANYKHREGQEYNIVEVEMDTITLSKDANGKISIADIRAEHNGINNMLGLIEEGKSLIVLDISIEEETANEVILNVSSSLGYNNIVLGSFSGSFFWGFDQGRCGSQSGSTLDATDVIPSSILMAITPNDIITGVVTKYPSKTTTIIQNNSIPNPFGYELSLFFSVSGAGNNIVHTCLSPAALTFYRDNLLTIIDLMQPTPNLIPVTYQLTEDIATGFGSWTSAHSAIITYGTITTGSTF